MTTREEEVLFILASGGSPYPGFWGHNTYFSSHFLETG